MPLLFTVLGSCLVASSVAFAAEDPANHATEPWWSNPPATTSPGSGPKVRSYAPAAMADSGAKIAGNAPPSRVVQIADFAPDPPGPRQPDMLPAVFQEDSATAASAATALPGKPKPSNSASPGAPRPQSPPQQLPATETAGNPVRPQHAATPASPPVANESAAPLGLGSHSDTNTGGKRSPLSAILTVGGSLAIVLGLFFVVAWAMRKTAPRGSLLLPKEVFEIMGRAPLGARQQVQLLRCGNKLLLVSITPNGTETLTEVTDPLEVDRLSGICQQAHPKSTTMAFRQVFQQLAPKSGEPPELESSEPAGTRRKRYRWEDKNA